MRKTTPLLPEALLAIFLGLLWSGALTNSMGWMATVFGLSLWLVVKQIMYGMNHSDDDD